MIVVSSRYCCCCCLLLLPSLSDIRFARANAHAFMYSYTHINTLAHVLPHKARNLIIVKSLNVPHRSIITQHIREIISWFLVWSDRPLHYCICIAYNEWDFGNIVEFGLSKAYRMPARWFMISLVVVVSAISYMFVVSIDARTASLFIDANLNVLSARQRIASAKKPYCILDHDDADDGSLTELCVSAMQKSMDIIKNIRSHGVSTVQLASALGIHQIYQHKMYMIVNQWSSA